MAKSRAAKPGAEPPGATRNADQGVSPSRSEHGEDGEHPPLYFDSSAVSCRPIGWVWLATVVGCRLS